MNAKVENFWDAYHLALVADIEARPEEYGLRAGEDAISYAAVVAPRMRAAVERNSPDFGRIVYNTRSFRAAARQVNVPFNRTGLNSIYAA